MKAGLGAWRFARVGLAIVGSIAACSAAKSKGDLSGDGTGSSSGSNGNTTGTGDDGGGGSGSTASGGGPSGLFTGNGNGTPSTGGPSTFDAACASSTQKGEQQGLNAYMMLDYSGSMVGPKWMGVTSAINSFVGQASTGISVGMQYFGQPDPDGGLSIAGITIPIGDSCDPNVYAHPAIEIAPLPGVGAAITQSLASHTTPNTSTPTPPALQGAIDHATTWAKAHASDVTIVILATDGDPSECGSANSTASLISQVETIAAAGVAQTPKILTFVIGVGTDTSNLNGIAQAGGTGNAFIVDTSQNVSQQFLAALDKIRGAALGCQYKIPVPQTGSVNFKEVNVQFTSAGGKPMVVPQVSDKSQCPASGDAWYYDNASSPTEILLCTTTCGTVSAGGELDVLTGCQTVVVPTK
jgi:Mg-chelatase subunit ChlD